MPNKENIPPSFYLEEQPNLQTESSLFGILIPPLPESDIPINAPEYQQMPQTENYSLLHVRNQIQELADTVSEQANGVPLRVTDAPNTTDAQLGIAVHKLASHFKTSPQSIASSLAENVNNNPKIKHVVSASSEKGYLNFELDTNSLGSEIIRDIEKLGDKYGEQNLGNGAVVVIDSSAPNIAKHMSVGHLRSTIIGESLSRIYSSRGYTSIRDNHLGDWGTQFGMLGRAHELWSDEIPELKDDKESVDGLYKLYVKMHDEIERQKELDPNGESSLAQEGRAWFKKLEEGDTEARDMWQWSIGKSLEEFQRVYDLLGSEFEYSLGESFYIPMLPDVNRSLEEKEVAEYDDKGALVVNLEDEKLNRLVIKKSDGTSLYASRDIATLVSRVAWFNPDKILYAVGSDQKDYFKQVFATFNKLAGDKELPDIEHVHFGMISLPEGKMSTRRGRVVFLEDVLNESIAKAKQKIVESGRNLTEEEIDDVSRQIGVGAVIYSDLGQGRERDIKFDMDKALSLDTNSAPYIQYAHARAKAILSKAEQESSVISTESDVTFESKIEQELVMQLGKFSDAITRAMNINQPSVVAEYTYRVADMFNTFYHNSHILSDENTERKNSRMRLTQATAQVIRNGLNLLGISAPDKM
jgi:arginyl-tRNA synthetase